MSLTPEQLNSIAFETALQAARDTSEIPRNLKNRRAEMVRLAKEIIQENRRLSSAGSVSDITSSDITALADLLVTYTDS
jgi:predicted XRE-type DNA-binding protein